MRKNQATQARTQKNTEDKKEAGSVKTESMTSLYMNFLTNEGFRPSMSDTEIAFKYEGKSFLLCPDETDRTYFHLVLPNIYEIRSQEEDLEASELMNHGNKNLKVVKVFKVDNQVWMSAECFMDRPEAFASFLERACNHLAAALSIFHRNMKERIESGLPQVETEPEEESREDLEKPN